MTDVSGVEHDLPLLAKMPCLSGMDLARRHQTDAAVVVLVVVPVEEVAAEGSGIPSF